MKAVNNYFTNGRGKEFPFCESIRITSLKSNFFTIGFCERIILRFSPYITPYIPISSQLHKGGGIPPIFGSKKGVYTPPVKLVKEFSYVSQQPNFPLLDDGQNGAAEIDPKSLLMPQLPSSDVRDRPPDRQSTALLPYLIDRREDKAKKELRMAPCWPLRFRKMGLPACRHFLSFLIILHAIFFNSGGYYGR